MRYCSSGGEAAKLRAWYPVLESELVEWIKRFASDGITVRGQSVKQRGQKLIEELHVHINLAVMLNFISPEVLPQQAQKSLLMLLILLNHSLSFWNRNTWNM